MQAAGAPQNRRVAEQKTYVPHRAVQHINRQTPLPERGESRAELRKSNEQLPAYKKARADDTRSQVPEKA